MLCWIIYRLTPQEIGNTLNHLSYVLHKGLIKYNNTNDITPMKTHIDVAHVRLLAKRKLRQTNITTTKDLKINHNWQLGKKKGCIM